MNVYKLMSFSNKELVSNQDYFGCLNTCPTQEHVSIPHLIVSFTRINSLVRSTVRKKIWEVNSWTVNAQLVARYIRTKRMLRTIPCPYLSPYVTNNLIPVTCPQIGYSFVLNALLITFFPASLQRKFEMWD